MSSIFGIRDQYLFIAMLYIARNFPKPSQIKEISLGTKISNKYLEQLVAMLRIAGLVRAIRGPHGGYLLCKKPEEILLTDITKAAGTVLFEKFTPDSCNDVPGKAKLIKVITDAANLANQHLATFTLADIIKE